MKFINVSEGRLLIKYTRGVTCFSFCKTENRLLKLIVRLIYGIW